VKREVIEGRTNQSKRLSLSEIWKDKDASKHSFFLFIPIQPEKEVFEIVGARELPLPSINQKT